MRQKYILINSNSERSSDDPPQIGAPTQVRGPSSAVNHKFIPQLI